jgi:glycerate 2-kinase
VAAADPAPLVAQALARQPFDPSAQQHVTLIAAGKAAATMAHAAMAAMPGLRRGLVAVPAGTARPVGPFEWMEAAHPVPDEWSARAGRRALRLASAVPPRGSLLVLVSGGASSMLAVPAEGLALADKAATSAALMAKGVPIADLNCVRKHLSSIKGGRLAAAAGWRIRTLAISDVHGPVADDPAVIGSGLTVPDPTTYSDALRVIEASGADVPAAVRRHLEEGAQGRHAETPKGPGPDTFEVIGTRRTAMAGATAAARSLGYDVEEILEPTGGEARDAGRRFAERARRMVPADRALCVVGAGETVVTLTGDGRGGRNQEFVLGAVGSLESLGEPGRLVALASAGTDGIDGPTDAAGGMADNGSARRAREAGIDLDDVLRRNDAYVALDVLGDLIVTGPTGTNVGDLHVMVTAPAS